MTFSEFGRQARQNNSNGTDHGTAAPHFVMGGAVRGGLYSQPPDLTRLDAAQNMLYTMDFCQLYSTLVKDRGASVLKRSHAGALSWLIFLKT